MAACISVITRILTPIPNLSPIGDGSPHVAFEAAFKPAMRSGRANAYVVPEQLLSRPQEAHLRPTPPTVDSGAAGLRLRCKRTCPMRAWIPEVPFSPFRDRRCRRPAADFGDRGTWSALRSLPGVSSLSCRSAGRHCSITRVMEVVIGSTRKPGGLGRPEMIYSPRPGLTVYRYSPLLAVLLAPIGALPDMLGSAVLRAVNLGLFAMAVYWWSKGATPVVLSLPAACGVPASCSTAGGQVVDRRSGERAHDRVATVRRHGIRAEEGELGNGVFRVGLSCQSLRDFLCAGNGSSIQDSCSSGSSPSHSLAWRCRSHFNGRTMCCGNMNSGSNGG